MALVQRFTNTGILQSPGTFDERGVRNATLAYSAQCTTTNYIQVPGSSSSSFAITNSDNLTIEFWWQLPAIGNQSSDHFFIGSWNAGGASSQNNWVLALRNSSGAPYWDLWAGNTYTSYGAVQPLYVANTWYHFAVVKIGSTLYFYSNGVLITSVSTGGVFAITNTGGATTINGIDYTLIGAGVANNLTTSKLSNLRYVKGVGVYTGNFTVPITTLSRIQSAGTNIAALSGTETRLLTFQNSTIIDNSIANAGSGWTLTNTGSMVTSLDSTTGEIFYTVSTAATRLTADGNFTINGEFDEYTLNPSRLTATSGTTVRKQTASTYQVYDSIDELSLAYTITPDKTIMNEGDTVTYTINAPLLGSGTLYYTNSGTTAAADFTGGLVYGVTPLTWAGTATATLWSFTNITQLSTSGFGTGAVFSIRKNNATTTMGTFGVLTVIPTSPGSGYQIGDTITISGASLGLTVTTNNLTITVGSDWFAQGVYPTTVTGTGLGTMTTGAANWTCPDGVYRISVAAVGGGGGGGTVGSGNPYGGGGGGCGYITDIAVVPGTVYLVVAGIGGASTISGGDSYFQDTAIGNLLYCYGGYNGTIAGIGGGVGPGTGFNGGSAGLFSAGGANGGGGGAGGLTAIGGDGGNAGFGYYIYQLGKNSASGGGGGSCGGGAGVLDSAGGFNNTSTGNGGGGGGVLLVGVSNLGLGGVNLAGSTGAILGQSGTGGSGGATGGAASATVGGAGGAFGGGGGGGSTTGGAGGAGAVRIIWNYPHGFLPDQTALTAVSNTVLLTAQAATPVDASTINNRISDVFGASINTTIIPFSGTYSYLFNGTTQYLTVPHSSNFVYGSGVDFTIEGWVYTSATTINKGAFYKRSGAGVFSGVNFGTSAATASRFTILVANATGSAWTVNDSTVTFVVNTWYHFAITKTNGNVYLYINGVLRLTVAHTTAIYDDGSNLNIGRDPGGAFWVGYLSNFRVVNGTALYSPTLYPSGFTSSTTPLTAVTNTKLLTLQSGGIFDNSGINNITSVPTLAGGNTIIPFAITFSYQFNGTSQFLAMQSSPNFIFGASDDFTIEGYLYTSATTINKGLIYKRSGSNISGVNFGTSTTTASRFTLKVANADGSAWTVNDETAGTFAISTWYHFAITKTNGVIYLYINGLMVRQYAHTTAIYDDGSVLNIGRDPGGSFWVGYLSNIRVIKGTALYYPPSTIVNRNYPDYPFVVQNSGSIPISGGTGTLALTVGQDILQEGVQDIKLQLRSDSTSGTVLATTPTVLVADTSRPLALPGGGQCFCAYPDYVSGPNLVYTGTPGSFTFTAPRGYTAVSAVAIGGGGSGGANGGGGGGGGALAYIASTAVTAGTTYTITCGNGGTAGNAGGASSFTTVVVANGGQPGGTYSSPTGGAGGTVGAGTGFAGGAGGTGVGTIAGGGGGGAGGYTAVGGVGGTFTGTYPSTLVAGSGAASATGGAGGSAGGSATAGGYYGPGGGGGGTSPFGSVAVASIAGTSLAGPQNNAGRGGGGSGGVATTTASGVQLGEKGYTANVNVAGQTPNGGRYGGGGGGGDGGNPGGAYGDGGAGCVRIIWGTGRAYPATLTADRVSGFPAAVGNPAGQQ